jgi:putative zinc finger/helix-turn-helix YgiT family protein
METRPYPWTCPRCRLREVYSDVVDYTTTIEHDGRSYAVRVPSLELPKCRNCGKLVMVDSANRRISEAFRREAGLMTPEEIRAGRVRCGLDQQTFADLLGISVSTLSRWETGAQIQQRSLNRLMEAYFASPEVREVYGRLSGSECGATRAESISVTRNEKAGIRETKMSTMTNSEQRPAVESRGATTRYWALKTAPGNNLEHSHWQDFLNEGVIAVGWSRIEVDPSQVSDAQLIAAIARLYPKDQYPDKEDPARIARKIRTFVDLAIGDLVLICKGYPGNGNAPVHIYGFARVTGPFRDDRSSDWWRFKHDAKIQPVEKSLPRAAVAKALGKGSLMETIHELDRAGIDRLAELLGVEVEV